jgi:proline iminopeptidase
VRKQLLFTLLLAPSLLKAEITHHTGTVHTAEVDLGYEIYGDYSSTALPIMAINGGPGMSHVYMVQNDLWERIAAHRLVVFYDQRGTGASRHLQPNAPQTAAAQIADLDAVRTALKLDRVVLVGDSYGGMLSMAYAAVHPEHVAKLVLSDSPPASMKSFVHLLPQVFPDVEEQDEAEAKKLAADPEAAAQKGILNHFRMCFYSPEKRDAYFAHVTDLGYVPAVADAIQNASPGFDLSEKITAFKFPTLVISGRFDMNVAPINAWNLAHAIPGARLVFFEKSGHFPSYEEPEKYQQVLEDFLQLQ